MPATWVDPPRDFVAGELITATIANQEWRDRMMYLKAAPAFTGNVTIAGTLTVGGILTVNGFGEHIFSATGAGNNSLKVVNASAGVANYSSLTLGNDADAARYFMALTASNNSTTFGIGVDSGVLLCAGAGGLCLQATHASGVLRFFTVATERLRITAAGALGIVATAKLNFDGVVATGDTYITESSANVLALVSGGITTSLTSGLLTSAGAGTHIFGATLNGDQAIQISNASTGTSARSIFRVTNDAGSGYLIAYGSTNTSGLSGVGNEILLLQTLAAPLVLGATNAAGTLSVFTGGTARRMLLSAAGVLTLDAYTAATFAAGDKYLVVSATGVVHVSALGPAS